MAETAQYLKPALEAGTVLVPAAVTTARRLVGVVEEVVDGTNASISRRVSYAFVDQAGTVTDTGPAPYLDAVAAPTGPIVDAARRLPWLARDRLLCQWEVVRMWCGCGDFATPTQHRALSEEFCHGGAKGIRTPDLLIANETRYQLRYSPLRSPRVAQRPRRTGTRKGYQGFRRRAR